MYIFNFLKKLIPLSIINYFWHLPIAMLANIAYGFPSRKLKVVGVTGTDGKTTTANMVYHILNYAGKKAALISTVGAKIADNEIETGFHVTTPEPFLLQKLFKKIKDSTCEYVVLEATSHGLDQYRLWGINFIGGIVTNITNDHLDYHKTWENYAKAKLKLFDKTKFAVLNVDDKSYEYFKNKIKGKIVTYGKSETDYDLSKYQIKLKIAGEYNKLNALAAVAACRQLGIEETFSNKALSNFQGVKGRMQIMQEKPFKIIVDFAHTPNALNNALSEIRKMASGKIISVFGCAGDRDPYRRRMGEISAKLADITIITAEDPRQEGVEKISNEIAEWAEKGGAIEIKKLKFKSQKFNNKDHVFIKIADRREAIKFVLEIAKEGDIVGVFGKGHEMSMCFGRTEIPWSDQEEINKNFI